MMQQPELGKKIAELRLTKGLTQDELARQCNLSVRTIQRIEAAEVTPRSYTIRQFNKSNLLSMFLIYRINSYSNDEKHFYPGVTCPAVLFL